MVVFNETAMVYNAVLKKQDGDAYATAISEVFDYVTKIHPSFKIRQNLR